MFATKLVVVEHVAHPLLLHERYSICWCAEMTGAYLFFFSHSLQDTFDKRSREASVEPATRPAEPYSPGDEDSRDEEDSLPDQLSDNIDDDDIA